MKTMPASEPSSLGVDCAGTQGDQGAVTVYFRGEPLPPLRAGNAWGFVMYPGGRMEVRQRKPETFCTVQDALIKLRDGQMAIVALADAEKLVTERARQSNE